MLLSKESGTISDERIIDLFWSRDETAIQETDRKYGRDLHGIAFRVLGDHED